MSQDGDGSDSIRDLTIRSRHTERQGGKSSSEMTVLCPRQEKSIKLEECVSCERCKYISMKVTAGGSSFVRCRVGEPAPAAACASVNRPRPDLATLLKSTPVSALMTSSVICVESAVSVDYVSDLLVSRGISGVPVVDLQGRPIGVVSKTDLLRESREDNLFQHLGGRSEPVGDIMTESVLRLPETSSVETLVLFIAREGVHRIPIISEDGKLVGIVSTLDVVRWLAQQVRAADPDGGGAH